MLIGKENLKCFTGVFNRLRYFDGLMLKKEDFEAEQHYSHEKAKLHNRLHGEGVVWGLRLTPKNVLIDGNPVAKLHIEPGFAIDCTGNEILVRESHLVDMESKLRELQRTLATINELPLLWIGITYCESLSNPEPQHIVLGNGGDPQPSQFSRVKEGYQVWVGTEDELSDCCKAKATGYVLSKPQDDTDCLGLSKCCSAGCPIMLGRIKDYLNLETMEAHPFQSSRIDTTYVPPMVLNWNEWERHKQSALNMAYESFNWVDSLSIIGRPPDQAQQAIQDLSLTPGKAYNLSDIKAEERAKLIERMEKATRYVPPATQVDWVVQNNAVILVIPVEAAS